MTASEVKKEVIKAVVDNLVGYFIAPSPEAKILKMNDVFSSMMKLDPVRTEPFAERYDESYETWRGYRLAQVRGSAMMVAKAESQLFKLFRKFISEVVPPELFSRASEETKGLISTDMGEEFFGGGESTD